MLPAAINLSVILHVFKYLCRGKNNFNSTLPVNRKYLMCERNDVRERTNSR